MTTPCLQGAPVGRTRLYGFGGDLAHPGLGLMGLPVTQALKAHKPPSMTRYGQRTQHQRRRALRPWA